MATITIKIESEQLAREVLTQLGYLPSDDVPDLISVVSEEPEQPEVPKEKEPRLVAKPESSHDAFAKDQINKVLVSHGLLPPVAEEVWCPEPNDEGFGTPIDHTMEKFDAVDHPKSSRTWQANVSASAIAEAALLNLSVMRTT